jgi:hypothetical protein
MLWYKQEGLKQKKNRKWKRHILEDAGVVCALLVFYIMVFEVKNLISWESVRRSKILDELYSLVLENATVSCQGECLLF